MEKQKVFSLTKANRIGAICLVADAVINLVLFLVNTLYLNYHASLNVILFALSISVLVPLLLAFGVYKKNNPAVVLSFFYAALQIYSFYLLLKEFYQPVVWEPPIYLLVCAEPIKFLLISIALICLFTIRMERDKAIRCETNLQI